MNIKHRIRNFSFFCFIIAVAILNALPQDGKSNSSFTDTKERFENKALTRSETPVECFSYEEDEDGEGIVITGYHGRDKDVVIPAFIDGMPVVALGYNSWEDYGVFEDCTDLMSVVIPPSVRVIGCNAFAYCTSLKEIIIPEGVDEIGCDAFWGCSSLVSITIPKTVKILASEEDALYDELYDETFGKCISLESIVVDSDNEYFTSVDGVLFTKDMETLLQYPSGKKDKHYVVPEGVEEIGESAFYYCKNLESVVIPEGVMYIDEYAFEKCNSLVSVSIPASVEEMEYVEDIFYGCLLLQSINVAKDNENYASQDGVLFSKEDGELFKLLVYPPAKKNANYDVPNDVDSIGYGAFSDNPFLQTVTIPEGVAEIGGGVFYNCTSLRRVSFPSTLAIGENVWNLDYFWEDFFWNSLALEAVDVAEGNENCSSRDGVLFTADMTTLILYPPAKKASVCTIPETVEKILRSAFFMCTRLESLEVEEGNENYIAVDGVLYQSDMKTLVCYPAGKKNAVYVVPTTVNGINGNAFVGCINLARIEVEDGNESFVSVDGVLFTADMKTLVCYPAGRQAGEYTVLEGVTSIREYAFYDCEALMTVTLPESLTTIGNDAFTGCQKLTDMTFMGVCPGFYDYDALDEKWDDDCNDIPTPITFHVKAARGWEDFVPVEGMTVDIADDTIDDEFEYEIVDGGITITRYIGNQTNVYIPSSIKGTAVTAIGECAFFECTMMRGITIPSSVTFIGEGAFGWCVSLERFDGIEKNQNYCIVDGVLYTKDMMTLIQYPLNPNSCMTEFVIPYGVKRIGAYAFAGEQQLEVVYADYQKKYDEETGEETGEWYSSLEEIGDHAFEVSNLKNMQIPDSVIRIGAYAFADCQQLGYVYVRKEQYNAISGDWEYYISSLEEIGDHAFESSSLEGFDIPNSVKHIGAYAFANCMRLQEARVAEASSLEEIGDHAFENTLLEEFDISYGVKRIGAYAFANCWCLTDVSVGLSNEYDEENDVWYPIWTLEEIGNHAFENVPLESFQVVPSVKRIGDYAFAKGKDFHVYDYHMEMNMISADSLEEIGDHAFENNSNLDAWGFPKNVKRIGDYAFAWCYNTSLYDGIPESVEEIGEAAFIGCRLPNTLFIPASVANIGDAAFATDSWYTYIDVDEANGHYASVDGILFTKDMKRLVQCPNGWRPKEDEETSAETRGVYTYEIPFGVEVIGERAFWYNKNLVEAVIPESVEEIGTYAFACSEIMKATIPVKVNTIGTGAFGVCYELEAINVDQENQTYASVDGVLFTKDLKTLLQYPLGKYPENMRYDIPDGVVEIAESAFEDYWLWEISIPESVAVIGDYAFYREYPTSFVFYGGVPTTMGEYWIDGSREGTLSVLHNRGWEDWEAPEGVTVTFRESFSLVLRKGWNLCAMPFIPDERCVGRLKGIGDCWGWVASRNCRLETIRQGQGFWLYSDKEHVVEVSGEFAENTDDYDTEYRRGGIASTATAVLKPGWNLVGKGFAGELTETSIVWTVEGEILTRMQWTTEGYVLKPGTGYWIFIP